MDGPFVLLSNFPSDRGHHKSNKQMYEAKF